MSNERELQEYEVANLVDDALASDSWNDHMLSRYVYEFKQGSQTIRGLTATAIAHIALESGISIESVEITYYQGLSDKQVCYTACAVKETGQKAYGVAVEATMRYDYDLKKDVFDKYAMQKAMTKACRNARRQLIPASMQENAIITLMALPNSQPKPISAAPDPEPEPTPKPEPSAESKPETEQDILDRARKQAFAVFAECEDELAEKVGVNKEAFWEGVRQHYNVSSRSEMTLQQWRDVTHSLRVENFASWIHDYAKEENLS